MPKFTGQAPTVTPALADYAVYPQQSALGTAISGLERTASFYNQVKASQGKEDKQAILSAEALEVERENEAIDNAVAGRDTNNLISQYADQSPEVREALSRGAPKSVLGNIMKSLSFKRRRAELLMSGQYDLAESVVDQYKAHMGVDPRQVFTAEQTRVEDLYKQANQVAMETYKQMGGNDEALFLMNEEDRFRAMQPTRDFLTSRAQMEIDSKKLQMESQRLSLTESQRKETNRRYVPGVLNSSVQSANFLLDAAIGKNGWAVNSNGSLKSPEELQPYQAVALRDQFMKIKADLIKNIPSTDGVENEIARTQSYLDSVIEFSDAVATGKPAADQLRMRAQIARDQDEALTTDAMKLAARTMAFSEQMAVATGRVEESNKFANFSANLYASELLKLQKTGRIGVSLSQMTRGELDPKKTTDSSSIYYEQLRDNPNPDAESRKIAEVALVATVNDLKIRGQEGGLEFSKYLSKTLSDKNFTTKLELSPQSKTEIRQALIGHEAFLKDSLDRDLSKYPNIKYKISNDRVVFYTTTPPSTPKRIPRQGVAPEELPGMIEYSDLQKFNNTYGEYLTNNYKALSNITGVPLKDLIEQHLGTQEKEEPK